MNSSLLQTGEGIITKTREVAMRKLSILGLMFMFLFMGLAVQTEAQLTPGPGLVAGNPEVAVLGAASVGTPRWLRDARGIQLGLCTDQLAGFPVEPPPCPGLLVNDPTLPLPNFGVTYYMSSVVMCNDPLECDQSLGAVPPNGEIFILEFLAGAENPAAGEPPEPPASFLVRLRNLVVPGDYRVETPYGNFGPFTTGPPDNQGRLPEIREFPVLAPTAEVFRGNGTAATPVPGVNPDPEAVPPLPLVDVPAFPGFLGNGLSTAPLNGTTSIFRVIGPTGSGIDVQTKEALVEGKVFTTPTAQAGGLLVERGTMAARGARATGVLFASSNAAARMQITQVAGITQTPPIEMTPDNATGRFFTTFPVTTGGQIELGISVTALDAAGVAIAELIDIAHVMQDTVAVRSATIRNGTLTVQATSSVPGSARAPGGTITTVESVPNMTPGAVGTPIPNGTIARGRFTAPIVGAAPTFVRVTSSLGGTLTVPVRTTPQTAEIITIRSAVFNSARGTLTVSASSSVRGTALTVEGVSSMTDPLAVVTNLGTIARGRLTVPNVTVPPAFVRVNSAGATMTVPVTIQ